MTFYRLGHRYDSGDNDIDFRKCKARGGDMFFPFTSGLIFQC